MTADLEVAYLGVQVANPTAFGAFLTDIVGLVPGETTADGLATWRNDERVHRIIVEEGPANDAAFVGLEAGSADTFERAVERASAAGATVTEGTASEAAARRVDQLVRIDTPWGVAGRARARARRRARAVRLPARARRLRHEGPGFRTRRVRDR